MTALEFSYHIVQLRDKLTAFAQSLTSNHDDAEDLFQETVYRALKYRAQYTNETNLRAWLYTIMKNTFINAYRRKVKGREYMENATFEIRSNLGYLSQNENTDSVNYKTMWLEVEKLDDILKVPFIRHFEGFKYKEIANELGLPIGTVKSRIFNARKILGDRLPEYQYA